MSEEPTQNLSDGRSFEERVLARLDSIDSRLGSMDSRFDSMDARLDSMDARLQSVESQAERRALETKPIWERALAEILEVKQGLENVERKLDVLSHDIVQVRADQVRADRRLTSLESESLQKS
jgi:tetrahydromethanopterin S-methyltransferase subunit G